MGDMILLSSKVVILKGAHARKLLGKWLGAYQINILVGSVAAWIDLPSTSALPGYMMNFISHN